MEENSSKRNNIEENAMSMILYSLTSNAYSTSTSEAIKRASLESLSSIGRAHPVRVLLSWLDAFERCSPGPDVPLNDYASQNRVNLLSALATLFNGEIGLNDEDPSHRPLIGRVISLVTTEMTRYPDIVPDIQKPCSSVLVALAKDRHVDRVIDTTSSKLNGTPHYYVIVTLGSIASVNSLGVVPYLKTILPVIVGLIKGKVKDIHKYAYSLVLFKFSESIMDYLANVEHSSSEEQNIMKEDFNKEMDIAHEILFSNWLTSGNLLRDLKLRYSIMEALSAMFPLLSDDRINKQSVSILSSLLSIYKKIPEPYYVTTCVSQLLTATIGKDSDVLDLCIEPLFSSIFSQILQNSLADYSKPLAIKNQYEVLRCYDVLACSSLYGDKLIDGLLARLKSPDENQKVGSLVIFKHLLNSSVEKIKGGLDNIINALHSRLNDSSVRVRKMLAQLTVLLGNSGHLNNHIGKDFVRFIVRQTANKNEERELAEMCDSILQLLANGKSGMNDLLWPNLLDYLLLPDCSSAVPSILKSICTIIESKTKDNVMEINIDYSILPNIAGSYVIFARLLTLSAFPILEYKGSSALILLRNFAKEIHEKLPSLWEKKIPLLQHYSETNGPNSRLWDQKQWEAWLISFLDDTIIEVNSEEWTTLLAETLVHQVGIFYGDTLRERSFVIESIGIVLKNSNTKDVIMQNLSYAFAATNHSIPSESEACARAFGYAAARHPDLVIEKLESFIKTEAHKSRGRGFILDYLLRGDSKSLDEARLLPRCTAYLSLAQTATSGGISSNKADRVIDVFIIPGLSTNDTMIKTEALKALASITKSLKNEELKLSEQLLQLSISFVREKEFLDKQVALNAVLGLLQTTSNLPESVRRELLSANFNSAVPIILNKVKSKEIEDIEEYVSLLEEIVATVMKFDMEQSTLDELFTMLEDFLKTESDVTRDLGSSLLLSALNTFSDNVTFRIGAPTTFAPGPYMIGSLIPRCFDSSPKTKRNALLSLDVILKILSLYEGRKSPGSEERLLKASKSVNEQDYSGDIIEILCNKISHDHMLPIYHSMLDGVLDKIPYAARGTSIVLEGLMLQRDQEMFSHAPTMALKFQEKLAEVDSTYIQERLLSSIRVLVERNPRGVMESLLTIKERNEDTLTAIWKSLPVFDAKLSETICDYLIETTSSCNFTIEESNSWATTKEKKVKILPLSAICSLGVMFQVPNMECALSDKFGEIIVPFTLALGSTVGVNSSENGVKFPDLPYNLIKSAITSFLSCKNHHVLATFVATYRPIMDSDSDLNHNDATFSEFIRLFVACLVEDVPHQIPKLISLYEPYLTDQNLDNRHTAMGFFSSLLMENGVDTSNVAEKLFKSLPSNCEDDKVTKILAIRGFSQYNCPDNLFVKLIGVLIEYIDDDEPSVVFYSMNALRKVIMRSKVIPPIHVLSTLGLKTRPFFDSGGNRLGEEAIRLFAVIVNFHERCDEELYKSEVIDQVRGVLTSVLLHLNDQISGIKSASEEAMSLIHKVVDPKKIFDITDYPSYLNEFCYALGHSEDFIDVLPVFASNCMSYFLSIQPYTRKNAIFLLSSLIKNSPRLSEMSENVCKAFDKLLNDQDEDVRITASLKLGCVYLDLFKNREL